MQRRDLIKLVGGCAATLGIPRYAFAQGAYKAEYKMSTVVPPAFAWGKGGEIFADLTRERTSGRINIKQYPGASLVQGQQDREFAAMRQGIIDVLCGAPINWAGTVPQLGVFTLPFILPDHKAYDAVISSPEVMTDYFDLVRKAGAEPLAVGETGYRQVSNSKRPILKPEDMTGIKIRVVGSPMYGEIMSGMGANPTFMSWADAHPALASGAVDAQENPLANTVTYGGIEMRADGRLRAVAGTTTVPESESPALVLGRRYWVTYGLDNSVAGSHRLLIQNPNGTTVHDWSGPLVGTGDQIGYRRFGKVTTASSALSFGTVKASSGVSTGLPLEPA